MLILDSIVIGRPEKGATQKNEMKDRQNTTYKFKKINKQKIET